VVDEEGCMTKSKAKMRGFIRQPSGPTQPLPEQKPPLAWMINRLQVDAEGQPLMEGIFSNYNDDILVEADAATLVGRASNVRGPVERIAIGTGLSIENNTLNASGTPGIQGPVGPVGPPGPAGASSSMFLYRFDSNTAYNDPGAGRMRYNASTPAATTKLYVDRLTQDGLDPTVMFTLATFDDTFIIQERGTSVRYQQFKLMGPATILGGDWFEVPVQYVTQNGANFSNNMEITALLRTIGKQGIPGPWTQITQAAYNALSPPDPAVLYVIIG
jgi:hypothetical protein